MSEDWFDLELIVNVAALHGIHHLRARAALTACLDGDNEPLRRLGYAVTKDMAPGDVLAVVREASAGQYDSWLETFDGQRHTVRQP